MRFLIACFIPSVAAFGMPSIPSSSHSAHVRGSSSSNQHILAFTNTKLHAAAGSSSSSTESATLSPPAAIHADNWNLLSDRGQAAMQRLLDLDKNNNDQAQRHVYGDWPLAGTDDEGKRRLAEQLADLDAAYPGGLKAYLSKAKTLLKESADGINPFDEYTAEIPNGEYLCYENSHKATMPFREAEQVGLEACADVAFVLVAGGLGERLGYSGIKLSLETNLCTNQCYLEVYMEYIQDMQYLARQQTGRTDVNIPLVIMTSGDTDAPTRALLEENDYFGMDRNLVSIVTQDKVPALKDGAAGLALDENDRWSVQTKPHGHGDVHQLLFRDGIVDKWEQEGKTHVIFLQDTNALVMNSIVPTLGVSVTKGFHMNSICIPRLAGEAAGAITRLVHKTDPEKSLVINVEYNQLDPLLRTQGDCKGDVPDSSTGYSPFPGNANNIIIEMGAYAKTLRGEDQGVVVEFVNPKYKDESRTTFKKPARLECMMQDIPKLFQKEMGQSANIGFTMFDRWFTFSPAKNAIEAGRDDVAKGSKAPGTMSSAESDKYLQNARKLKHAGADVHVATDDELVDMAGIPVTPGPRIILKPSFGISQREYRAKVKGPVKISERSSVVLGGHHLTIKSLEVDGALILRCGPESYVTVEDLQVQNKGWDLTPLDPSKDYPEHVKIRGYTMTKHETMEIIIKEPGHFIVKSSGEVVKQDT
ncbi:hypothetical protein MPSEU_000680100 [Mayamaea pseudoterrestris]|nr:hypothetical protein MPSEU_000680100 [Mayamaea pseudoterrestris]